LSIRCLGQGILAAVDLPVISNAAFDITMPVHGKLYMVTTHSVWILFPENEKQIDKTNEKETVGRFLRPCIVMLHGHGAIKSK
jgi:hypothetical protein